MEFRGSQARPTRPQQTSRPASPAGTTPPTHQGTAPMPRKKRQLVVVLTLVLLVAGAVAWQVFHASAKPDAGRYQAVFLDNGQVFFGKLKNVDGRYLTLEEAYYTQKQDLPENATPEQKAATNNNVSLVQVGDEVYGPENTIQIKAEQVLFWQDLKSDSKVAKAIDSEKE